RDDPKHTGRRLLSHAGQPATAPGPVRIPRTPRGVRPPPAFPDAVTTRRHTAPDAPPSPRRSIPTGIPPGPSRRMSLPEFTLLPDGLPARPRRPPRRETPVPGAVSSPPGSSPSAMEGLAGQGDRLLR